MSNAIVLGSFVRDRGTKKQRFRFGSIAGSSSFTNQPQTRARTLTTRNWGSDEDLVRDLGIGGLSPDLVDHKDEVPRPAPMALPLAQDAEHITPKVRSGWTFPTRARESASTDETDLKANVEIDEDAIEPAPTGAADAPPITPRRMSFFDVGGLLGDDVPATHYPPPLPPPSTVSPSIVPQRPALGSANTTTSNYHRRSSSAFLQDMGGLLSTKDLDEKRSSLQRPTSSLQVRNFSRPQTASQQQLQPTQEAMAELAQEVSNTSRRPSPMSLTRLKEEGRDSSRPRAAESTSELRDVGGLLD